MKSIINSWPYLVVQFLSSKYMSRCGFGLPLPYTFKVNFATVKNSDNLVMKR